MITAVGGGIIRDVLLGALPPATFVDWRYLAVAATGGLIAFLFSRWLTRVRNPIDMLDAAGLSPFAVTGAGKALELGVGPAQAIILGPSPGVGGGTLRDADQPDANMLNDQNRMLDELLGINPNTVVVMKDSNPVLMPWIDKAPAVLEAWNQGTEDGHVAADLLFGVVNPSGKVPTSYLRSEQDSLYAGKPERYPGTDEGDGYPVIRYSEGLAMGYRWFQSQGIKPLFGFGFGLSYTTFDIADVSVDAPDGAKAPVTVTTSVTNTGAVAGAEVVQVYLGLPVKGQPPSDLSGSRKCSSNRESRSR
jgi:hypothetical protein